jgi:hypothetical protein
MGSTHKGGQQDGRLNHREGWVLSETGHEICNGRGIIVTIQMFDRLRLNLDGRENGGEGTDELMNWNEESRR